MTGTAEFLKYTPHIRRSFLPSKDDFLSSANIIILRHSLLLLVLAFPHYVVRRPSYYCYRRGLGIAG